MGKTSFTAVVQEYNKMIFKEFPVPEIGPDEGILRVELTGVCSTDPNWFQGKVTLRALPIILGHESVGVIEEIGEIAAQKYGVKPGDRVVVECSIPCTHCWYCVNGMYHLCDNRRSYGTSVSTEVYPSIWGSYGQYMYIAPGSLIHKVPDNVSRETAVIVTAVLGNGVRWINHIGKCQIGETVLIQGVGPQGLCGIIAAKESGAGCVIATGLSSDQKRMDLAKEMGADIVVNVEKEDTLEVVRHATGGRMADLFMDVTGNPAAIAGSLDLVRKGGRIVQAGTTGTTAQTPMLLNKLTFKEISFLGTFSHSNLSVAAAMRVAASGKYPIDKMVTHTLPLKDVLHAFALTQREVQGEDDIKVLLDPWA
jgi:alcohol dehydrogenase